MKKLFLTILIVVSLFFLVAAVTPPESIVPAIAITVVSAIFIPLLIEGIKLLVSRTGWDWLVGKTAASIYGWVIALALVVIYFDWKALPAPPSDPTEWIKQVVLYASLIAKAAEFVYNLIISKIFDGLAKKDPSGLLGYKLQ